MDEYLKLFHEESDLSNRFVLGSLFPQFLWEPFPHILRTWLRIYIAALIFYFFTGFLWCFNIYYLKPKFYNSCLDKHDHIRIPPLKKMVSSVYVSMKAMPCYAIFPTISNYMVERGWTKCFPTISEVGWYTYVMYVITYLVLVEFITYWLHRWLHEIKPLYNHIHYIHHIYNNKNSISPFTGFAFHPVEGWLMVLPHVIALFIVPTHFATHHAIMFINGLWTVNIHDCIDGSSWPLLGSGHHTLHHILQRRNYGLFTVFMDIIFGTFRDNSAIYSTD